MTRTPLGKLFVSVLCIALAPFAGIVAVAAIGAVLFMPVAVGSLLLSGDAFALLGHAEQIVLWVGGISGLVFAVFWLMSEVWTPAEPVSVA